MAHLQRSSNAFRQLATRYRISDRVFVPTLLHAPTAPPRTARQQRTRARDFSTTPAWARKSKPNSSHREPPGKSESRELKTPDEALDFGELKAKWKKLEEHYRDSMKKATTGGGFSPDVLGKLPVAVAVAADGHSGKKNKGVGSGGGGGGSTKEYPLSDLAQIIEGRGRNVIVRCHEESYVKAVMSAVQKSPEYNQQPQHGEDPLELIMKMELRKPEDAQRDVRDIANAWRLQVRDARSKRDKQGKAWKSAGMVGPDLFRKMEMELQKVQEAELASIGKVETELLKKIQSTRL